MVQLHVTECRLRHEAEARSDRVVERRYPRGRRVAIERRSAAHLRRPGKSTVGGHAIGAGCLGIEESCKSGIVGPEIESQGEFRVEAALVSQAEQPAQRGFGVGSPGIGRIDAQPGEHHRHRCIGLLIDRIGRDTDVLGGWSEPGVDLGEADAGARGSNGRIAVGDGVDGDFDRGRAVECRVADGLAWCHVRVRAQSHGDAAVVVDRDADRGDDASTRWRRHLPEHERTGTIERFVESKPDVFTERVAVVAHCPGRVRVAVDGHHGTVFGAVREGFAVARHDCGGRTLLHGDGLRGGVVRVEEREALVGRRRNQHVIVGASWLGVAVYVLGTTPVMGAVAVGISDDEEFGISNRFDEFIVGEGRAVADEFVSVEQPGRRCIDDAVGRTGEHDRASFDSDRGHCVIDTHERERRNRISDSVIEQRRGVGHRHIGSVRRRCPDAFDGAQPGTLGAGQQRIHHLGPGGPIPLEGHVVGDQQAADSEQTRNGGHARHLDRAFLETVIERIDEIHRRCGAEWEQFAGQQWCGPQPGQGLIGGVPPPKRPELRSREL